MVKLNIVVSVIICISGLTLVLRTTNALSNYLLTTISRFQKRFINLLVDVAANIDLFMKQ